METLVSNDDAPQEVAPKKRSKLPLILGLILFLALGGGGFYAVYSGMILGSGHAAKEAGLRAGFAEVAFVPIDQLTISLGKASDKSHLQFTAQLEVNADRAEEVEALSPRILDVINGYLRAVDMADLVEPDALVRLRAQLLRRIQMVTGQGCVRDLLVTEFVLD
jgi:flagellar FliL protein